MVQERFWKEFHQLKVQVIYVQELLRVAERNERLLKIVTAITSSTSIAAWIIWKEWAQVWGGIIAGSQVLSAVYPQLPYKERLRTYSAMLQDLEKLMIDVEHKWQGVADGSMTTSQINRERTQLQTKKDAILNKHMPRGVFPSNPKIAKLAEIEATNYFSNFYPDDVDQLPPSQIGSVSEVGSNG